MSTIEENEKIVKSMLEQPVMDLHIERAALVSAAISLKRIADFVCGASDEKQTLDIVQYLGREMRDALDR